MMTELIVKEIDVKYQSIDESDYTCIIDIVKYKMSEADKEKK